jgi:serine/threonine protein kinase/tetratricopeptide (TPR) repeat protein
MSQPPSDESIFLAALEQPSAAAQAAYLDGVCGTDAEQRRRVERLLAAHPSVGSFLEQPAAAGGTFVGSPAETVVPEACEGAGTVIGPYTLLEKIGEGGMGVVYRAEQQEPLRRLVALKIIKSGLASAPVIARFEAERQALALMDHPHIAKVFDAGTVGPVCRTGPDALAVDAEGPARQAGPTGRPYFVMELVPGVPLTRYCDDQRLTLRQRLELFVPVCQAIQHAHQKGIIHRDVKPSNILVTRYDGKPVPKVIDFGVAKALDKRLTQHTLSTTHGQIVGTFEYMAPEQAGMSPQGVDTRADIYSLGVVLYELLTGTTPLGRDRLRETPLPEVLRRIQEEEAVKPSLCLARSASLPIIAAARRTEPAKLPKLVRSEQDWIVMKALEKDRARRYETANGLARDLERYLADEPVEACPPSAGYRLKKFARKYRKALVTAAAFVVLLLAGIAGLALGLVSVQRAKDRTDTALGRESKARQRAQQALDEMSSQVIEDWLSKRTQLEPAQQALLQKALAWYEELTQEIGDSPEDREAEANAYYRIATIHLTLGQAVEAEQVYGKAITAYAALAAADPGAARYRRGLAQAHRYRAHMLERTGQLQKAEAGFRDAIALHKQLAADFPEVSAYRRDVAETSEGLANLLERLGRTREGEEAFQDALAIYKQLAADYPTVSRGRQDLARCYDNLSLLLQHAGRHREAEQTYGDALTLQRQLVADFPEVAAYRRELALIQNNRGSLFFDTGRRKEAEEPYRDSLALYKQLAADFPAMPVYRSELARTYYNVGLLLALTGRPKEGEAANRDALALYQELVTDFPAVPDYRYSFARAFNTLGLLLSDTSRAKEAEAAYRQAIAIQEKLTADLGAVPGYRVDLAGTQINLGRLISGQQRHTEALPWFGRALALLEPIHHQAPQDALARNFLYIGRRSRAWALDELDRPEEALADWDRAFELSSPAARLEVRMCRARCWARVGKAAEAAADAAALTKEPGTAGPTFYNAAYICSLAAAERGLQTPPRALREQYAGQAMDLLRRAQAAGFFKDPRQVEHLKKDAELAPLRAREDYRKLVAELEAAEKK